MPDLGPLLWILTAELLYLRALRVLAGRGVEIPRLQVAAWHAGMALWVVGLLTPVAGYAEDLLSAHMVEHLLIADLGAPLLLVGLRTPMLQFFLPRPLLVKVARSPRLRSVFRTLRRPLVAIPLYALSLYFWHFGFAFEAAVDNGVVHAAQHASFVATGVLVWWSALEPKKRRMPGELWKIGHILAARLLGMMLGMGFVLIRVPVYVDVYGSGERALGLSAVHDQQLAGGLMVVLDIFIMMFALVYFFVRSAQDYDRTVAPSVSPSSGV